MISGEEESEEQYLVVGGLALGKLLRAGEFACYSNTDWRKKPIRAVGFTKRLGIWIQHTTTLYNQPLIVRAISLHKQ